MARKCHSSRKDRFCALSNYQLDLVISGRMQEYGSIRSGAETCGSLPAGGGTVRICGINVLVVLVVFALTLSALVYAREYERTVNVDKPIEAALNSEQWVQDYELRSGDREIVIYPSWSGVFPARLEHLLHRLSRIATDRYELVTIADSRTARLEEQFYHAHLVVNQALLTGDLLAMESELDSFAATNGLDCVRAWFLGEFVLVLVKDGDSFMYEAVGQPKARDGGLAVRFEGK